MPSQLTRSNALGRRALCAAFVAAVAPAFAAASPIDAQAQARALLAGPSLAAAGASLSHTVDAGAAIEPQEQARRLLAGPRAVPARTDAVDMTSAAATNPARRMILGKDA